MVFSSFIFLFGFLPIFLTLYLVAPKKFKNTTLLIGSYFFYGWGAPQLVPFLLVSCVLDYYLAKQFVRPNRKMFFILSVLINVSLLGYFKYTNFFVAETNRLLQSYGYQPFAWSSVVLPIGISFFTFHKISYLADVYIGKTAAAETLLDYLLYIVLFPQLIAGPIIRYHDIADQIKDRKHTSEDIFYGICRFCWGLGKKVLIADELGKVADNVFQIQGDMLTPSYAWLGIIAYAYQIYFDFSGYSDMALGLGRIFGFHFLENFNMPYISQNITEFWRRWHISLSNWMREYLYIPLGGNRCGTFRNYANLWIVFFLSGLWHGASWTFIFWGIYHGLFLTIDKVFWIKVTKRLPRVINVGITFLIVLVSWVMFRANDFGHMSAYLKAMFDLFNWNKELVGYYQAQIIHERAMFVMLVATICSFGPVLGWGADYLKDYWRRCPLMLTESLQGGFALTVFLLSVLNISTSSFSPFLYFRF